MKLKVVHGSDYTANHHPKRTIMIELRLGVQDRKALEAYLDHIHISVNALVRKLVLDELLQERIHYGKTK
jgi:hypothetical protein